MFILMSQGVKGTAQYVSFCLIAKGLSFTHETSAVNKMSFRFTLGSCLQVLEKRHASFQGVRRTSGNTSNAAAVESTVAVSSFTAPPAPSVGLVVDQTQPSTSIQVRLADGTRMVSRFNFQHSIRDIRGFIDASRPGGSRSYQLQTVGFPPKELADLDQTIEQADLANSVVIQKI